MVIPGYLDHVHIYVYGSCLGNGRQGAQAGYGVHVVSSEKIINRNGRVLGTEQTNKVGELAAIYAALGLIETMWDADYTIYTDSDYALRCLETYHIEWQRHHWVTTQDEPVENGRLIKLIAAKLQLCREAHSIVLRKVQGHAQMDGNNEADRLADKGARGLGQTDLDFSRGVLKGMTIFTNMAMCNNDMGLSVFFGTEDKRNMLRFAPNVSGQRYIAGEIQAVLLALRYIQNHSLLYDKTANLKIVVGSEQVLQKITLARTEWPQSGWMVRGKPLAYECPTFRHLWRQICSLESLGFSLQFVWLPEEHERAAQAECIGNAQGVARYRCNAPLITLMSPN